MFIYSHDEIYSKKNKQKIKEIDKKVTILRIKYVYQNKSYLTFLTP